MPSAVPSPSPTGHLFEDACLLTVEVNVSDTAAAPMLPPPLELADDGRATVFFADYPKTAFGPGYKEAGILLHAVDADGPVMHCPWIVVDDDTPLILGRELFGFPKKLADVRFDVDADTFTGVVHRKGHEVMRIDAVLGEVDDEPAPVMEGRAVNVLGSLVTGMKLVEASTNEEIKHARRAKADVQLWTSSFDRLGELEATRDGPARYVVLDYGAGAARPRVVGDVDATWALNNFFVRAR